jgi:ribonuclease P/MRP protein subunit RPP40
MEKLTKLNTDKPPGPVLFLMYVNELPAHIKNSMKMFADDTKIWGKIKSVPHSISLQEDLDHLAKWSDVWQMKFNANKCTGNVMQVGHGLGTKYYMTEGIDIKELETVQEEKDMGRNHFTSLLKPSQQCVKSAATARKIIGMVRRNFKRLDKKEFNLIYKTYIRPHLEYCVQAWSPYLVKDINTIEKVQKDETNLVPELKKLTYQEKLNKLGLTTLKEIRGDLIDT